MSLCSANARVCNCDTLDISNAYGLTLLWKDRDFHYIFYMYYLFNEKEKVTFRYFLQKPV